MALAKATEFRLLPGGEILTDHQHTPRRGRTRSSL